MRQVAKRIRELFCSDLANPKKPTISLPLLLKAEGGLGEAAKN